MTDLMIGSVERITPAIAKAMLCKNAQNRPITQSLVNRYADEMRRGRWNTNGQGIIFTPEGELLDGQHRLLALIAAGITLEMFVVRGVPAERFETMDSGRARTVGDVLGAQNYHNSNQLAAIARLSWNYIAGASIGYGPSKAALIQFVHRYPYLTEITGKIVSARAPLPASPLGAVLFLGNAGHRSLEIQADEFLEGVKTGADLCRGDPRLTVRDWFYQQRARERGNPSTEVAFAAIARAWNAYAQGRELSVIRQLYGPNRRTLPIMDFDPDHFTGVEDLSAKTDAIREANLALGPSRQKAG
jgi:hypothetical protein